MVAVSSPEPIRAITPLFEEMWEFFMDLVVRSKR
jgi:hypothetical protein